MSKITLTQQGNEVYGLYKDGERIHFFSPGDDPYFYIGAICDSLGVEFESRNQDGVSDDIPVEKLF